MWSRHSCRIDPMSRSTWPFCHATLVRRVVTDPHGLQSTPEGCPVRPVAIPKQTAGSLIPGERLGDLPGEPHSARLWTGLVAGLEFGDGRSDGLLACQPDLLPDFGQSGSDP
jgi:hypothetical protein